MVSVADTITSIGTSNGNRWGQNLGANYWPGYSPELIITNGSISQVDRIRLETDQIIYYNVASVLWPAAKSKSTSKGKATPYYGNVRVSQANLQVLGSGNPNARISQMNLQVLGAGNPYARVSQFYGQLIYYVPRTLVGDYSSNLMY